MDIWLARLKGAGVSFLLASGRPMAQIIVWLIVLVLLLWLLWQNVWIVLQEPAGLAPGVTRDNPQLDVGTLQRITADRQSRTENRPPSFAGYSQLLVPVTEQSSE